MKKICLLLLCSAFLLFTHAQSVVLPLILEDDETTISGILIDKDLPQMVNNTYGINDFRPKDFNVKEYYIFNGDGALEITVDAFKFEFAPNKASTYSHDIFNQYAKAVCDKISKVADDGKIFNGFYNGSKEISFEESIKVVDKSQDRRLARFYYKYKGQSRKITITERSFKDGGFTILGVDFDRVD